MGQKNLVTYRLRRYGDLPDVVGGAFYFNFAKGYLVLVAILAYIAFFAISLGPLAFVVIAEIFSNRNRGMAMSVCIFFLWIAVYAVSQSFPMLLDSIGSAFTFWIYMVMSVFAFLFVYKLIPETKGKSLEEIELYWLPTNAAKSSLRLPGKNWYNYKKINGCCRQLLFMENIDYRRGLFSSWLLKQGAT